MAQGLTLEELKKKGAKPVQKQGFTLDQLKAQNDPRAAILVRQNKPQPKKVNSFLDVNSSTGILPYERINNALTPTDMGDKVSLGGTVGNQVKSVAKLATGFAHFLDPVANAKTVAQTGSALKGYNKDVHEQQASEQGVKDYIPRLQEAIAKDKAIGKDTTTLERLLKEAGGAPKPISPTFNTQVAKEVPGAVYESFAPGFVKEGIKAAKHATPEQLKANTGSTGLGARIKEGIHAGVQSIAEDPQQLTPYVLMGKKQIEKNLPSVDKAISKTGQLVTKPAATVASGAYNLAKSLATYGTAQATGMSPKTIKTIIDNPKEFSSEQMKQYSREGLGQQVHEGIQSRLDELQATGSEYQSLRETGGHVRIPMSMVKDTLGKYGLTLDKAGKIKTSAESVPLKSGDIVALQSFVDQFGSETKLSNNAFLNARQALSHLSEYDATKSDISNKIARDLRTQYDDWGKTQMTGLKELDSQYAPEVTLLNQIKKDYLNSDGTFKDNALSKISNLTNQGREKVLGRLEKIDPDIAAKVSVLNAVEDIQKASGQKTGTYIRAGVGAGGLVTGNIPAIVAAVISAPEVATQILRGYGKLQGVPTQVLDGIIKVFTTDITKIKPGLTIEDVSNQSISQTSGGTGHNLGGNIGRGTPQSVADEIGMGTRPLHQVQLEKAINSGDYALAHDIIAKMPDSDPYKAPMITLLERLGH